MRNVIVTLLVGLFASVHLVSNAQCCGNSGGCGDLFKDGGMYIGYSTSRLTEPVSDIEDAMTVFNTIHSNYTSPYTFNQNGRGLHAGVYYYLDDSRRSFLNMGYTNKHYISKAEGDSAGYEMQHLLKCRQGTLDLGLSYLPAKFLRVGLEFNAGMFGAYKRSGPKENIKDAKYEKYYSDQGFLFGVTPSVSLRIKLGFVSFYITPYYQWTPGVITHFDSNNDGTIDENDKRYSNNLSNYGVNFSMYLFIGGFAER